MASTSTDRWESLERWSATLFLVAGGLLVVHAGIHVLTAFTSVNYPLHHEVPFGFVGMMLGHVALLGLYPQLIDRSPRLAQAGAVPTVLGAVGWLVIGASSLAESLGVTAPPWLGIAGPFVILGVVLGYLVFGVAGLRTDVVSRTTALVLVTPALVMVFNVTVGLATGGSPEGAVVVASGFALAHLGIGVALRAEEFPTGRAEQASGTIT